MQFQKIINDQMRKSKKLQQLSFDSNLSYEKSKEIRKLQQKEYNKYLFLKNLSNVWGDK